MNNGEDKKQSSISMILSLPREIILDILSRLPIASLVPIKFLCRAGRTFSQDPDLVRMHYSRIIHSDPSLVLHSDCPVRNQIYCLDSSFSDEDNGVVKKIDVPSTLPAFDLVASCNGLLCLCDSLHRSTLYVINPFTKDCIELPRSTLCSEKSMFDDKVVFGFGYNPKSKEYKVIKIANHGGQYMCRVGFIPTNAEIEVLTIGSSTWRVVQNLRCNFIKLSSPALINGRLHWITWQHGAARKFLAFDIVSEQLHEIPKPDCDSFEKYNSHLVVLRGCLAAASEQGKGGNIIEIWVMRQYNVKESWIKEFSIGAYIPKALESADDLSVRTSSFFLSKNQVRVLCNLKNEEILLLYKCRALVSYDPKSGEFKDLMYQGMPNWFKAVVHVGSLNWIDHPVDV
ncbi:putative F-box and associated interaction domains-containing protein [Tripterygium wilfordii]|uniref:Putative F-box and associated interaction domains-containing protein n=1 Tax=Tripterygium wilfordii TaxID=458696 RepID=A0A7J7D4Z8_TRIWF|nr:F-box protein At3g07870-like [Tripterygium wilfordii]XP_038713218.1 F-box protein At3g07870-like [Tripterygium wilfordii]KAF5741391.1 putative F-box and associated interaction domains-containing protein [Tripterygium wilfordii]